MNEVRKDQAISEMSMHEVLGIKMSEEQIPAYVWANKEGVNAEDLVFAQYILNFKTGNKDLRLVLVFDPDNDSKSFLNISLDLETGEENEQSFPDIRNALVFLVDQDSLSKEVWNKIINHRLRMQKSSS